MGLTTAMYTGLTGLNVNQTRIETIGNNLANVNTTAFKGSRTLFQTQVSQLLSAGNAPNANSGGVNPTQVGLGALVGGTQKVFTPGSIETTGVPSDLAIDGSGFFIVRRPNGQQLYTRDGSFSVDSRNRLVTVDGYAVRGFGVDSNFNVIPTVLTDLSIPLGTTTIARPTSTVIMDGDLSAASTVATRGSISVSQTLLAGGGGLATADTLLTDLRSASDPGVPLLAAGNTITVAGVEKGEHELPRQSFVVGQDGNTLGDFARWLEGVLGINKSQGLPGTPGVTVENGALTITSNAGQPNAIRITTNDFSSDNANVPLPFTFTQTQAADGSGVSTAFTIYDSLGNPLIANLTFVLEATPPTGPVWRFYAESPDNAGGTRVLGTGLISFDTQGRFLSVTGNQLQLDRSGSGAASPQTFTLDFTGIHGLSTLASSVVMAQQDGYPPGTLTGYRIGQDGTINGTFSNGLTRTLGQIAIAAIPNPEGLIAESDNAYSLGPNSGNPTITAPGTLGAGQVLSGALELSNVDLSREFIGLITSSTGFQAASRVVSTSSDLLDQLLLIVR
jgi:flagellar hook protein FlgE